MHNLGIFNVICFFFNLDLVENLGLAKTAPALFLQSELKHFHSSQNSQHF